MGKKFEIWHASANRRAESYDDLTRIIWENRNFVPVEDLNYGDHGLEDAFQTVLEAIETNQRIALYADYDVDGTMSCVSWIWFFRAIGFENFVHYIPCRFKEGYGVNLEAVEHLIDKENAELIITMDTGITANTEAAYAISRGVKFICTDHHMIQKDKMPSCVILNPKTHPDPSYQELCGCGITFVLLRKLGEQFRVSAQTWTDILALTGMATICDVVPLNGVNHRLAQLGVKALLSSRRKILQTLRHECSVETGMDEKDVGFRLGPRINAVGRLEHADAVVEAFIEENPSKLVTFMSKCNDERKLIQSRIIAEATELAKQHEKDPILFLGGDWHPGVVGIAASKIAEVFWKPTWLFNNQNDIWKGSARAIPGFDVTGAMQTAGEHFEKFGGHKAAGGFSFRKENFQVLKELLIDHADEVAAAQPGLWQSSITYDCEIPENLASIDMLSIMDDLKPFGHKFEEPMFLIEAAIEKVQYYKDKLTGELRHTAVFLGSGKKVMFFNEVFDDLEHSESAKFLVNVTKNQFRGRTEVSLIGRDYQI